MCSVKYNYCIAQIGGGENFGESISSEFQQGNIKLLTFSLLDPLNKVDLEFGWVKYWRMMFVLSEFSPTTVLRHTV